MTPTLQSWYVPVARQKQKGKIHDHPLDTARAAAWIRYRRTLSALARLDDHMLRDIGISRSGIEHAAKISVR